MRNTPGRNAGLMDFDLFRKIVDDICDFETPIRVLRLYKDGEPLLHPKFPEMVRYAKDQKCSDRVDTTTNASRLTPELNLRLADAGLDRINISIYGLNAGQYKDFSKAKVNFDSLVANIRHLFEHRGKCEMIVKINGDLLSKDEHQKFYDVFGDIADGVLIEHVMSCWPEFDVEAHGVKVNPDVGIYGQPISEVEVCPYVFYSFSINSDGRASSCFLDWERKLIIGDAKTQSVKDIWNSANAMAHRKMMLMKQRKQHPVCHNCDQMRRGHPDKIDEFADDILGKVPA
jgi:radical SAM protein with 4Fe4S-binding SPASM domain